jgi:hypothetical protein
MLLATVLATVGVSAATAALATPAAGTVGNPQPELAQFKVGTAGGGAGSGAVLPDGNLVLASPSESGTSAVVCLLHAGGRSCASTAALHAFKTGSHQDSFYGTAEVLATGGKDVSVVLYDCCYIPPFNGGAVVFNSTNDGKTFSGELSTGNIAGVGAATVADGQLVVGTYSSPSLEVQAFPPTPSTPVTTFANPNRKVDGDTSLTTYHGGVLVASDDTRNTFVEFAPSGSDFNASSSYKGVGTFPDELVTAVSGDAMLTDPDRSITGGERLRFFNGKSFGKAFKVPDTKEGDDGYFTMQEVSGVVHVFFEGRRYGYDAFSETTRDGVHWSPLQQYGSAITSASLMPVLGPSGAGLLYETDSKPLLAQPILNAQAVTIKLAKSRVTVGTSTSLSGQAAPHLAGQIVTLEKLSGGRWYNVTTTHESSSGKFSFSVPGRTETYRAVVAYVPGYYLFGYSGRVSLTAVPKA